MVRGVRPLPAGQLQLRFSPSQYFCRPCLLQRQSAIQQTARLSFRNNSTAANSAATEAASVPKPKKRGVNRKLLGTTLAVTAFCGYLYFTDTRASAHRWFVVPMIRWLYPDAEDAHHAGTNAMKELYKLGLHVRERGNPDGQGDLATEVFGYTLSNPIGISGGLDKNAEIPDPLYALGPAIIEVGGITPLPQPGNPRPRVFRLPSQSALINRYGLNSQGADQVAATLSDRVRQFAYANGFGFHELGEQRVLNGDAGVPPGSLADGRLLAVQVAKNKVTPDKDIEAVKNDYVYCVNKLGKYADILVVNVSSPNTPGLRDLQQTGPLTAILKGVVEAAKNTDRLTKPRVMVKVSPDEDSDEQIAGICDAVRDSGVDGIIVGNTTNKRPDPLPRGFELPHQEQRALSETGGYSGPQLFDRTVSLVGRYRDLLDQQSSSASPAEADAAQEGGPDATVLEAELARSAESTPSAKTTPKVLFASGGITSGKQAREVLDAGATVAMVYTTLQANGAGTITRLKEELRKERQQQRKD